MSITSKKIITGTSYIALSNGLGRVASFITLIIVTHALSLYEYGLITLALAITGPVFAIIGLGLDQLIETDAARYLGEQKEGHAKKLLISFYAMRGAILLLILLIGWFARGYVAQRYGAIVSSATLVLMAYIIVQYFKTSLNTIIQTHQKFGLFALMNGMEPFIRLGFIALVTYTSGLNVVLVLGSYVIAPFIGIMVCSPWIYKIFTFYNDVHSATQPILRATILAHGKWQSFTHIISAIADNAHTFVIQFFLSTEAVAIFAVAQSASSTFANVFPLKNVLTPIIAERASFKTSLESLLRKTAKYAVLMYITIAIVGIACTPFIIHSFFPKYGASIVITQILLLKMPLLISSVLHVAALNALREQKFMSGLAMINIISTIVIMPASILLFGVAGKAIEAIVVTGTHALLREWRLRKKHHIRMIHMRDWMKFDDTDRMIIHAIRAMLKV